MSNIIVQKFGGTSVASPKRIEAVAKIVGQEIDSGNHVAVVVSAMAGETNRLIDLAKKIQKKPDPREFDAVVSSGEQVSAALLAMSLKKKGYNSKSYNAFQMGFKTDSSFGRARIRKVSEEIHQDALEKRQIGLIAQEVEKVIPEIVEISKGFINVGKEREMKTISYPKLVPYLVDTIQELTKRIEKLEKKVK